MLISIFCSAPVSKCKYKQWQLTNVILKKYIHPYCFPGLHKVLASFHKRNKARANPNREPTQDHRKTSLEFLSSCMEWSPVKAKKKCESRTLVLKRTHGQQIARTSLNRSTLWQLASNATNLLHPVILLRLGNNHPNILKRLCLINGSRP